MGKGDGRREGEGLAGGLRRGKVRKGMKVGNMGVRKKILRFSEGVAKKKDQKVNKGTSVKVMSPKKVLRKSGWRLRMPMTYE